MSDLTDIKELGTVKLGSTVQDFKVRDGLAYVATIRVNGGTREETRYSCDTCADGGAA